MKQASNLANNIIRLGFIALVLMIAVAVIYSVKLLFIPLALSFLLAIIIQPVINFFETKINNRLLVITGVYVAVAVVLAGILFFMVPWVISEVKSLAINFPEYERRFESTAGNFRIFLQQKIPFITIPDFRDFLDKKAFNTGKVIASFSAMASGFFSILSMAVLVPVFLFFFLADGYIIQKAILKLVPNRYFEMMILLIHKIVGSVQMFIRGQLIDALSVAVMTSVGLSLIGLPYFLIIGIIAGVGNLIPYLGPVIGFLPAFFTLAVSPEGLTTVGLVKLVAVFAIVQFLEGTFVYPLAVGKSVNLHPLIVLIGITVGGQLGGVVGMLVTIPIIAIVKVTVEVVYAYLKQYSIL